MTSQEIITQLAAEVEATVTVEGSAGVLIEGLSSALKAATSDPSNVDVAAIQAIIAHMDTEKDVLAAKVAANTIAAPAPDGTVTTPAPDGAAVGGAQASDGFKTTQA